MKYGNIKTVAHGIQFHSKKEALRYIQLKQLEKEKKISELELQPKFVFTHNGVRICAYSADFGYVENGKKIIEDVKGYKTDVYRMKRKLMKAFYNIDVLET